MKKVVVLIDGQNLFYSLKNLRVLEREINWGNFLKCLLEKDDELIRTYWFRPQKISDTYYTTYNIRTHVLKTEFRAHYADFKRDVTLVPPAVMTGVDKRVKEVEDWIKAEKAKFASIEYNYDQIGLDNGDIEFVKTGIVKINPYIQEYIGEKGVDISLAVKMISLSVDKKCDKVILISGDYDYSEAIKYVKNNMTKIHIVKFHNGYPPKNKNMSRDLSVLADKVIDIYESDLTSKFIISGRRNKPDRSAVIT